ncbi:PKD domain-containing protein [Flammeovirga agarivorans]|uniref:PKD domain-containing protein n=1 Tax=Flammeovirga agarivorans TaxID=2726742 RepID=A0A7X8XXX5_9BACT|nr:PKD domain-containing protein [Flammeovirga agarivorans]NLR93662.1 PKD domain-containing protein [Flammeovirga agarivorans]
MKNILKILPVILIFGCDNSEIEDTSYKHIDNPDAQPYISEVIDFKPAPGQFMNKVENDFEAAENIVGNTDQFISLGAFGGEVTFKFDHSILNKDGNDIAIYANSFENSSEPGIVMVCQDLNHNGYPDDNEPWYELKGSEYNASTTKHNVSITYYRPTENDHIIPYKMEWNGEEQTGEFDLTAIIPYHDQPMFPTCYLTDEITFSGTLLASNVIKEGDIYYNPKYEWGYCDNAGYENEGILRSADVFDISNAVDDNGQAVHLIAIDFVKVYTATFDNSGWLGERSTEVFKAADISLLSDEE